MPIRGIDTPSGKADGNPWEDVGTAAKTQQLMGDQPRGVEVDFCVIAVNKACEGTADLRFMIFDLLDVELEYDTPWFHG